MLDNEAIYGVCEKNGNNLNRLIPKVISSCGFKWISNKFSTIPTIAFYDNLMTSVLTPEKVETKKLTFNQLVKHVLHQQVSFVKLNDAKG